MKTSFKILRAAMVASAIAGLTGSVALAGEAKPAATPATTSSSKATTNAKPAEHKTAWTKDQIKAAQEALAKGGYYKGEANGTMNSATHDAVKAWQKANKMPVNGKLTQDEFKKLTAS